MAILLNGWIFPVCGASSGRVYACSLFFERLAHLRATALIFELNQGITSIKLKYGSHSPLIEGVFEKTNICEQGKETQNCFNPFAPTLLI